MPSGLWLYSYLALWALLLAVSLLLVAVIHHLRELYGYWVKNDPEWGLPLGALAPAPPTEDLDGRPVSLGAERGRKTLLVFLSRGCRSCYRILSRIPALTTIEGVELIVVVSSKAMETRLYLAEGGREARFPEVPALADGDRALMNAYRVAAVPYLVVVDEEGRVAARGTGASPGEVRSLLNQAGVPPLRRQTGEEGQILPDFLADVEPAPAGHATT